MRLGGHRGTGRSGGWRARHAATLLGLATSAAAIAQSGAPGTVVANTAEVRWTIAGRDGEARSNTDRLIVAERLDVRLAAAPAVNAVPAVDLTNAGSGEEAFAVAAFAADGAPRPLAIVADADGDGRCDPAADRPLAEGRTVALAAGATLRLLVCDAEGAVRVTARAVTGSGAPGTAFEAAGDGGGDAVVGATGAAAALTLGDPGAGSAAPRLVKSQVALAPDGSARAAAGGTIAYTLAAHFAAATAGVEIEDPIPAGTTLVPGSLALDGEPLTDAAVADGVVHVALGDVPAGSDHRVTFTVTVDP